MILQLSFSSWILSPRPGPRGPRCAAVLGPGLGLCLATAALLAAGAGCGPESLAPPRLLGMEPDGRASYEELAVQILGQGFTPLLQLSPAGDVRLQAAFSAWLVGPSGEVPLQQVRYLSAERLQAVVPAGLPRPEGGGVDLLLPGPYRLVLHTPQGGVLVLKKAFEVRLPPQLFAIRPSRRSTPQGGGPIELEGRHFVPGSAAWIGAASVLEQELASPELIRGRVPPGQPGVVDVKVVSPYGEAVLPHSFTYVALASLPTVLGVEPRRGSIAGATPIRVWGTGFDAATMVTIAGRPLVEPRLVVQGSGREIHGLTPAGKAGPATVAATNASGSGPGLIDAFFFESPARLEAIVPAAGPQWGGTRVVLHGDGFGPGMRVLLGGAELDDLAVQDARTASGTTPPGRGSVLATVFAGGEAHTLVDGFRYLPPPTLSMVNPASGPALGPGDPSGEVVLHGSGFSVAGLAVSLGGRQPPWLQVVDDHRLRLRLPSGSGPVDLVLRTELGVASLPGAYTYREPPRVDLLVPGRGRPGELVEVHGEHLGDDPQAALGDAAQGMAPLRQSSGGPSLLSGRIPEVRGLVSLLVSSRHGSLTMPRALLVLEPAAAPQLRGALPLVAAEQGGLPFALLGERFPAAARVTIGGRELGEPWRIGDHALLGLLPPGEGDAPIVVSAPGWSAQLPQPLRYESDAPPLLSAVVPPLLGEQPGTLLRIFGANLAPGVRITLGGLALLDLVQVSAEELRGRDPGGPAGPVVLLGETDRGLVARDDLLERVADAAGGGGSGPGPLLFAVEPERGPIGGGFPLTIIGFGLEQVVAARLGGVPVTALQRAGPGRLQGRAPAGVPGRAALTVELAGGQQGPLLEEAFAYRPDEELLLVAVEPAQGLEGGGTPLLVHGGGFTSRTRLFLAGVPLLEQRFGDARTIVARSPPGLPGHAGLTASRDGSEVSLPLAFHYLPAVPLRLSGIQPAEGAAEGGTEVLVEGQGFAAATRILLGGRALLDARVEGGQRVRGRTPPGRGPATLRAEAAGVAVELPAAYRFVAVAERPRISVCEPGWASAAGGTLLRLLGSSLERVVSARLGDRPLGELALVDGHTLLARSPALPAGGELDLLLSDVQGEAGHLPAALRVIAPPRLEELAMVEGPEEGGSELRLTFSGSTEGLEVLLGSLPLQQVEVEEGRIVGRTPPGRGKVSLTLRNPAGQDVHPAAFAYLAQPRVAVLEPAEGPAGGGSPVLVAGSGFSPTTVITLGGLPLGAQRFLGPAQIAGLTPGGFGLVDATAEEREGELANLTAGAFRYLPPLHVRRWWPWVGKSTGGTLLTVEGEGLAGDLAFHLGEARLAAAPAGQGAAPGPRRRSLLVPPGEAGSLVELRMEGSTGHARLRDAFLYLPPAERVLELEGIAVRGLAAPPDGGVWLASERGLFHVAGPLAAPRQLRAADTTLPDDDVRAVAAPAARLLLAATASGLAICSDLPPAFVCRPVTALDLARPPAEGLQLGAVGRTGTGETLAAGPAGLLQLMLPGGAGALWTPAAELAALGLPGSERRQMVTDGRGDLWLATDAGVVRFAASTRRFAAWTAAGTDGAIPSDRVLALAATSAGEVYAGTELGLARFVAESKGAREGGDGDENGDEDGLWETVAGIEHAAVDALAPAPDGTVWALVDGGLLQVAGPGVVRRLGVPEGVGAGPLLQLTFSAEGCLWLTTPEALWRVVVY